MPWRDAPSAAQGDDRTRSSRVLVARRRPRAGQSLEMIELATTLVLGGARSGKSRPLPNDFDASTAREGWSISPPRRQATTRCRPALRITASRRGDGWRTVEVAARADAQTLARGKWSRIAAVLVDCLTLWLNPTSLHACRARDRNRNCATSRRMAALRANPLSVLVSNEIGLGLVPETRLGRRGTCGPGAPQPGGRRGGCQCRVFVAAGLPLRLKGQSLHRRTCRHESCRYKSRSRYRADRLSRRRQDHAACARC